MITILLDSSNTKLAVGLAKHEQVLDSISYEAWQQQSEFMIPELDKMLTKHGVNRNDISKIAVSIGPGSYTGVRIAITIAKVLALATGAKLYPISSLQILKHEDKPSICLVNARSNRSYIGVYQNDKVILPDQIMTNDDVRNYIEMHPDYIICGDTKYLGVDGYVSDVIKEMNSLLLFVCPIEEPLGLKPTYLKD